MVGVWKYQPSEFWKMSPQEFWLLADTLAPKEYVGSMEKNTFDKLVGLLEDG